MPDDQTPPPRVTIRVKRNGPYLTDLDDVAHVLVVDQGGRPLAPEAGQRIALCRCGGSSTKPFCDGTHRRKGFDDGAGADAGPGEAGH